MTKPPTSKPVVYIAGPMTGLPDYNYPAFHEAAERWRAAGWEVVNPAEHFDGDQTLPRQVYLRRAFRALCECHAIAVLEGWETSQGARVEKVMADALGMPRYWYKDPPPDATTWDLPLEREAARHVVQALADEVCCVAKDVGVCKNISDELICDMTPGACPKSASAGSRKASVPSGVANNPVPDGPYIDADGALCLEHPRDVGKRLGFTLDMKHVVDLDGIARAIKDAKWEPHRSFPTGAVRDNDTDKPPMHLLTYEALAALAQHSGEGAKKYAARNWEKGIPLHAYADSGLRHMLKWTSGWDDEDHLVAALWNLAAAVTTRERAKAGKLPESVLEMTAGEAAG